MMPVELDLFALVIGVIIGALGSGILFRKTNDTSSESTLDIKILESKLEEISTTLVQSKKDLETERFSHQQTHNKLIEIETRSQERAKADKDKIVELGKVRESIEADLKKLTTEALQSNQSKFFELASEHFKKNQETTDTELKVLLEPVKKVLTDYQSSLKEIEKERQQAYGTLTQELKGVAEAQNQVRAETGKLVNALRAAPKTRGRWGEETLRNVMELSGMSQHCDFVTESSIDIEDGKLRPDVIINLPGDRKIVVDAKTSLDAYLEALNADTEEQKEASLAKHSQQIRNHMKNLASKKYQDQLSVAPDFVAMFIPGENFYAAAVDKDPNLFSDAIQKNVLIVTPTTLIALAKAIGYGWKQVRAAENAHIVSELGAELYKRLCKMGDHIISLGKKLDATTKQYNSFIGSLESNVLPKAREMEKLGAEMGSDRLTSPEPLETSLRLPRSDRDLSISNQGSDNS